MPFKQQMQNYFPSIIKAEDNMRFIHSQRYNKNTVQELNDARYIATVNNKDMLKYIEETKTKLLQLIQQEKLNKMEKILENP